MPTLLPGLYKIIYLILTQSCRVRLTPILRVRKLKGAQETWAHPTWSCGLTVLSVTCRSAASPFNLRVWWGPSKVPVWTYSVNWTLICVSSTTASRWHYLRFAWIFLPGWYKVLTFGFSFCSHSSGQPQRQWLHSPLLSFKPTNIKVLCLFIFFKLTL